MLVSCSLNPLTTTAASFFKPFGFLALPWDRVNAQVKTSAEFQGACPDTATAMRLRLAQKIGYYLPPAVSISL